MHPCMSIPRALRPHSAQELAEGMRAVQCAPLALLRREQSLAGRALGSKISLPPPLKRFRLHRRHVLGVAFARKSLITCSADGLCRVLEAAGDFAPRLTYAEHSDAVLGCMVVDERRVVTWSRDCSVKLWDLATGKTLRTFSHARPVRSAFVAADLLFTFSLPQTLSVFDLGASGAMPLRQVGDFVRLASPLVVAMPYLVCGTFGAQLHVCELTEDPRMPSFALAGHSRAILAVAVDEEQPRSGSRLILSGSEDRTAILFDLDARAARLVLRGHTEAILSCAVSSRRARGMTCSADKTSRIWSLESGDCLMVLACSDSVTAGCFSATLALCGCADNSAILFDVLNGDVDALVTLVQGRRAR